ncbi:unnamed protein product [Phytomonas sp. EM1]|nr:unnamed protein product [Phytomonas sp. EM1]|eukprot:CCW65584.1 unnamed protein product [Phytomonas sp. isolate EM1]
MGSTPSTSTHATSSRPPSGASLPYIKSEESVKFGEMSNLRLSSAQATSNSPQDEKSGVNDNGKVSSISLVKEVTQTMPITPSQSLGSSPAHELGSSDDTSLSTGPLWKVVLAVCPTLSEEILPGIYLHDLNEDIREYPRVRSVLNQLKVKCNGRGKPDIFPIYLGSAYPERALLASLKSSASELRARTLSMRDEMPFLSYRVGSILLANLHSRVEQDASFQSLCSIRRQIIRGAVGNGNRNGIGYPQRLERVEQCLRDAASLLARTSGFPMISAEKAEASIAILSQFHLDSSDVIIRDDGSSGTSVELSFNASSTKQTSPELRAQFSITHPIPHSTPAAAFSARTREKVVEPKGWKSTMPSNPTSTFPPKDYSTPAEFASSTTAFRPSFPEPPSRTSAMKTSFSLPLMSQQELAPLWKRGSKPSVPMRATSSYGAGSKSHLVNHDVAVQWRNRTFSDSTSREEGSQVAGAAFSNDPSEAGGRDGRGSWVSQNPSVDAANPSGFTTIARSLVFNGGLTRASKTLERGRGSGAAGVAITPAAGASLREVYQQACLEHKMRPNTGLLYLLPAEPFKRLASLDLSANYVGSKGIIPLLVAIKHNGDALRTLRLSHNNLENMEVMEVVDVLFSTSAGNSLTDLDLSYNPISRTSGQAILDLCIKRPNITNICLDGTTIPRQLLKAINETVGRSDM